MRRAAAAAMAGFTFGGMALGVGHQHDISDVRLTAAIQSVTKKTTGKPAKAATPATKTVEYRGYEIKVPASWPVYRLSQDPRQCVRYDVNAVYLGTPGPDQDCPPHVVGRTDTVSIGGPAAPGEPTTPVRTDLRAAVGAKRAGRDAAAVPGTIMQNAQLRELAVAMPDSAPAITATYGTDPSLVMQVLTGAHRATSHSALVNDAKQAAGTTPGPEPWPSAEAQQWPGSEAVPQVSPSGSSPTSGSPSSSTPSSSSPPPWVPPSWPVPTPTGTVPPTQPPNPVPSSTPPPAPAGALAGFDTCTAPSLSAMKAWRAKYAAAAIYIGGQEMGCDYGNLSKSWVQSAEGMGWSLMPTFVGLQAPCNSFSDEIKPSQAAAEGQQAATQAVADAASFGLGPGTPIYYDMEAYNETKASCVTAVLTFLSAWDSQLQASGYVSGVYSSAGSGVVDLQTTTSVGGHPLVEPQAIWFALWDNATNLTGSPYMTSAVWSAAARSKQYAGPRVVKIGGVSLDIDSDLVDGPVAQG
jgi:hypothetical protein